jgi:transcriptional regulator of acetoin/glycerol metabolism
MSGMAEEGKAGNEGIEQIGMTLLPKIEEILSDWRWRVYPAQAAYYGEDLGISRTTLWRRMKE